MQQRDENRDNHKCAFPALVPKQLLSSQGAGPATAKPKEVQRCFGCPASIASRRALVQPIQGERHDTHCEIQDEYDAKHDVPVVQAVVDLPQ